ncbi:hypothetical protein OQH60_01685 [Campylobacter sp. MIT 21-1685]|uniref:hypothetical protein n=1 Tax=unclassified Campylobacter TaxID=2593542 RepID=UPI00224AE8D4|nr:MULTISPECIES: hypothetical protein [unclassified Campylobacter]MCX2682718.1 hypothetical protein [Campylobacter sp. MIT 21-1684]MCX2751000.1 hypothetical protein [Campylobacter sp. MIT 21-1682]MCX2807069.1 hypothetical protein [Campylobacter sp. MIT 21-1685]
MVKKICFFLFFASEMLAISSLELAKNLLNDPSKNSKLQLLFSDSSYEDENGNLDLNQISRLLKTNSLLNLTLPSPQSFKLNFKAKADAVLFFKILNDVLNDAGYVYFIPTDLILRDGRIDYTIQVQSQYILDPGTFYMLLKANSVYIENVKHTDAYTYEYDLNFDNVKLSSNINLALNTPKSLEKPLKDYVFSLQGAKSIFIQSNAADNWFPKLLFLDKNLNLIQAVENKVKTTQFSQSIPNAAIYVIVSDMYSLDNIRRGLSITLKK